MDVTSIIRNQDYLSKFNDTKDKIQENSSKSDYITSIYNQQEAVNNTKDTENLNNSNQYSEQKEEEKKFTREDVDDAVKKLNKFFEDEKTHAEYEKHEDLGTLMIKIVDDETDKVIIELPPKNVLDMIASMCKEAGILDKKV